MSEDAKIRQILGAVKTIAVVGWSPKPDRPSHRVAAYLAARGYRVIVPHLRGYGSTIAEALARLGAQVTLVSGPVALAPPVGVERVRDWVGNGAQVLVRRALAGGIDHADVDDALAEQALALFGGEADAGIGDREVQAREPGVRLRPYTSGAGGLYSTAADYLRFARMLAEGGVADACGGHAVMEKFADVVAALPHGLEPRTRQVGQLLTHHGGQVRTGPITVDKCFTGTDVGSAGLISVTQPWRFGSLGSAERSKRGSNFS